MEIWKDIEGTGGRYSISNYGNATRNWLYKRRKGRDLRPLTKIQVLKFQMRTGYRQIAIWVDHKEKRQTIHRLVALHFMPNPLNLPDVNHIDGNKLNNHISNLEWCTRSHNIKHAYSIGLRKKRYGEFATNPKLTDVQRSQIIEYRNAGLGRKEIAKAFNVSTTTITYITNKAKFEDSMIEKYLEGAENKSIMKKAL